MQHHQRVSGRVVEEDARGVIERPLAHRGWGARRRSARILGLAMIEEPGRAEMGICGRGEARCVNLGGGRLQVSLEPGVFLSRCREREVAVGEY